MATPGQNPPGQQGSFQDFGKNAAAELSQTTDKLLDIVDLTKSLDKEFGKVTSKLRASYVDSTALRDSLSSALDVISKMGKEYTDVEKITKRLNENTIKLESLETGLGAAYSDIAARRKKNISTEKQMYEAVVKKMDSSNSKVRAAITSEEKRFAILYEEIQARKVIDRLLGEAKQKASEANKEYIQSTVKATALSKIFKSMSNIPFLNEFMEFRVLSDEFSKGFGTGMKALGSQLMTIFRSPLFGIVAVGTAFVALIKAAAEFDKKVTAVSNNLGISKDSTNALLGSFRQASAEGAKYSQNLDSALMSITNQVKALTDMQSTLGTNALLTRGMIEDQIMMTKQLGLSEDEAAGINKLSLLTGQSAEKILQTSLSQNKTSISYRKIMGEISKINAELSVAYKNNPELIAQAVIQANKLGMSLEQTQKIAKSLLDFETSIGGELEAELLLSQRFNFEKARALALDGKSAEAAAELLNQIGGMNSLTQMNVIQRERVAAAIGLSADELSTAAKEQAVLNALGVQNRKALEEQYAVLRANNDQAGIAKLQEEARKKEGGELLLQDIARLDLSTRFNETMARLKEMIVSIVAGPLGQMLNGFTKLISNGPALQGIFNSLKLAALAAAAAFAIINPAGALAAAGILSAGLLGYAMTPEETTGTGARPTPRTTMPTANAAGGGFQNTAATNTGGSTNVALYLDSKEMARVIAQADHKGA